MTDFVLEILSEEIPAKMQKNAVLNFVKIAEEILTKNNLKFSPSQIKSYVTPLRLVLEIQNLQKFQEVPAVKRIGPKVGADEKAIAGFLRSTGLNDKSQLQIVENANGAFYVFESPESKVEVAEILKNSVPQILQKMTLSWPKLMRFDVENLPNPVKWIRVVRNILCLFGDEVVEFEFFGLKSSNCTLIGTHAFEKITVKNNVDYQHILANNSVILSPEERKKEIAKQIKKITSELNLETVDDLENSALIEEVVGLCENPHALVGEIDEEFLQLPKEILILTLKYNQKYFCLKNSDQTLAKKFIFINNIKPQELNKRSLISDNQKLVKARLTDAKFFVDEDLKLPLEARISELKNISFHPKLGSVFDKIERIKNLSKFLSLFVPHADLSLIDRAADLMKVDLTTKAVAEFTELQGKIGNFYALQQKENGKVASAIYEHYLPLGPNSELPKTSLGITLSIADKIDSIVGFFLANEKPTSSKDPYALRRAVLGIVRIGFEYNITFPIRILVEKSLNSYPVKLLKTHLNNKDDDKLAYVASKKALVEEIIIFFVERLKIYLKENEAAQSDVVNAVIAEYLSDLEAHKYCDILYLANKIKFLSSLVQDQNFSKIIALYKRSANILAIEEKKDGQKFSGKVSLLALKTKEEKVLYRRIKQIQKPFKKFVIAGDFAKAFELLHVLELPLEHFFDHVTVNDKNQKLRQNRLTILSKIRALFNQVADLSKVEI